MNWLRESARTINFHRISYFEAFRENLVPRKFRTIRYIPPDHLPDYMYSQSLNILQIDFLPRVRDIASV